MVRFRREAHPIDEERRAGNQNLLRILEKGQFRLPERQSLLQALRGCSVIQPVARVRIFRRWQKSELVMVLRGTDADTCVRHLVPYYGKVYLDAVAIF